VELVSKHVERCYAARKYHITNFLNGAFAAIWQVAQQHGVTLRTATFIVACQRILHAREMRGLYP
jgi:glutamate dehydrogenase (NAD(P)+)